jgi:hypothetical protein
MMIVLECNKWNPTTWGDCIKKYVGEAFQWFLGGLFDKFFEAVSKVVLDAVTNVIKAVGFLWVYLETPDVANNGPANWIQEHTYFMVVAVGGIAVMVAAVQMAFTHRGEPVRDILKSLLTLVVVSTGAATFAATLITAADKFSAWLITKALGSGENAVAAKLAIVLTDPIKGPKETFGFVLVIFVGILMVITALVQLALMVVRYGMLVLLVGMLPLTAAATNTEMGMMWFKRAIGWLVGFIIYKPVAALIYATAIILIGGPPKVEGAKEGTSDTLNMAMGITLMIVAVVALPAILRFVSPKPS